MRTRSPSSKSARRSPAGRTKRARGRASASLLSEYRRKRDFSLTREPRARTGAPGRQAHFVIQEHHARRLHYDLRLEADGVLKSWAVTKMPVMDPAIRRLAVRTEDHPLEYASFEGEIPAGQYGAGQVKIWDEGTYENLRALPLSECLNRGKAEVLLHGRKLRGAFALIRMARGEGHENWLLLKMKSEKAPPEKVSSKSLAAAAGEGTAKPAAAFKLTHLDKVMFPEKGYTKGDLLRYYAAIAPLLVPFLRDRPVTFERMPDGVFPGAPHFWQKHAPAYYPDWLPRTSITSAEGSTDSYFLVNDSVSLLYAVNQGVITFHPWLSRVGSLDTPDVVVFDLDPGLVPLSSLVPIAHAVRKELEAAGRDCVAKTSGKSGLHVVTSWSQPGGYDAAREWAITVARRVVARFPDVVTMERRKLSRKGRAYLDVMQNGRGQHVVPPYVVRPVPSATVSTPLRWEEVNARLRPGRFDMKGALKRFEQQGMKPIGGTFPGMTD